MSFDIVGIGSAEEEQRIKESIANASNCDIMTFHGRIPYPQLGPYPAKGNIGVAFVPIIDAQQSQPYTKMFEYLLSAQPVLATANSSNLKVINRANGVLLPDTIDGVYSGPKQRLADLHRYDSRKIRSESTEYSWTLIINQNVRPFLHSIMAGL